jgi:uncharacterized membrane protein YidH (DUF202 family)
MTWFPRRLIVRRCTRWASIPTAGSASPTNARWERRERAIRLGGPLPPSLLPRLVGAGLAIVMVLALVFVLVEVVRGGR